MEKSKVQVAVVGVGGWGKNLVRNFYELGALKSFFDATPKILVETSLQYPGIEAGPSFAEILGDKDVNAIVIATPAQTHYQLAKAAMLAGKDVFVEKPMTLRVEEAEELVELSRIQGRILFVGHLLEYHPAVISLKALVNNGKLGGIRYMFSSRLNFGKFRLEEDVLWSFAPHDISMMIYLLGAMPEKAACSGYSWINPGIADVTLTRLTFPGNVYGHIHVSWLHYRKVQELVLQGERAVARFDDQANDKLVLSPFSFTTDERRFPVQNGSVAVPIGSEEPLKIECREFLDCVITRRQPRTDGENGLRVVKVLDACRRSMQKKGEKVDVK